MKRLATIIISLVLVVFLICIVLCVIYAEINYPLNNIMTIFGFLVILLIDILLIYAIVGGLIEYLDG